MREIKLPVDMDYSISAIEISISAMKVDCNGGVRDMFFTVHLPSTSIISFKEMKDFFDKSHCDILLLREENFHPYEWMIVSYCRKSCEPLAFIRSGVKW